MATVRFNSSKFNRILSEKAGELAERGAGSAQMKVRGNISRLPRVDSGRMREAVAVRQVDANTYQVHSGTFYTKFQEKGTRAHGPVTAKALRFKPKGQSSFVFAKWVRGVEAGNFFRDTPGQMDKRDFTG